MPESKHTYIDLFAGCGGLSTGLHLAGWHGLFAVERNPSAFKTLKANLIDGKQHFAWPNWLEKKEWDIRDLIAQKRKSLIGLRGSVDMIVGGPPCQGFSTAGRRKATDERNNLVHLYLEFVDLVRPRCVLFENVRGFTMRFKGTAPDVATYSELVISELKKLGYGDARGELVDMSEFGVPQHRQRYIVIATKDNISERVFRRLRAARTSFLRQRGIAFRTSAKSAISDLEKRHGLVPCPDTQGFHSGIATPPKTGLQRYLRASTQLSPPDSHRYVNHTDEVELVFSRLLKTAPRNRCVAGSDGNKFGLKKRSITVMAPNKPAPTITTIPDDMVHYCEPRVMTVRECARIQTFPDWFEFKGPYTTGGKERIHNTPRYTQVGNAVPPLFAEQLGNAAKEVLADG